MKKSRVQYRSQDTEKWVAVRLPLENSESDTTRRYEFRESAVNGLLEIDDAWSAIILNNDKQILVNSPLPDLRAALRQSGTNAEGIIDLTSVTGLPYTPSEQDKKQQLRSLFAATQPAGSSVDTADIVQNPSLKITVFAHFRLDENPNAKYCQLTTTWDNIHRLSKSVSGKNVTCLSLKYPVEAGGICDRDKWWVDINPAEFQECVNLAMMHNIEHIDLREDTRKCVKVPRQNPVTKRNR